MKSLIFTCFLAMVLVFPFNNVFADCPGGAECEEIHVDTGMSLNADQFQHYSTVPDCNSVDTIGDGSQVINGNGTGMSIEAEAELMQYEPYSLSHDMENGSAEHSGTSFMHVYGAGSTDAGCPELSINIENTRSFSIENQMTPTMMDSKMSVNGSLIGDIWLYSI
ncbi:MAG: hypothetical protein ABIA02_01940 [Candidatus Falkowbacteria bacterium]